MTVQLLISQLAYCVLQNLLLQNDVFLADLCLLLIGMH